MTATTSMLLTAVVFVLTLGSGMPIFVGLGITGAVGSLLFVSFDNLTNLGDMLFGSLWQVSLLATPGFILMGSIFFRCNFGKDIFDAFEILLGKLPGGLIISAIWLGAGFGFICGSNLAGVATVGQIAIPEVERRGYNRRLSLGAFAIAGTLAALIPPSLLMIIYAVLAEVSLGALFFAGIIPGILLTVLLSLYIVGRAVANPALCPKPAAVTKGSLWTTAKGIFPLVITFVAVFGGIYSGVWSVVEASAAGALMAIVLAFAYRRLTWKAFVESLDSTLQILSLVYMIMLAAVLFNHFVFVSGLSMSLKAVVAGLNLPGWGVVTMILVFLTIMGMFLDLYAMLLIAIPVFLPLSIQAGYDAIWFGIVLIVACELALVTPPVGLNLFIIRRMAPEGTTQTDLDVGALPYVFVVWVLFALMIAFPQIVLWLPHYMVR